MFITRSVCRFVLTVRFSVEGLVFPDALRITRNRTACGFAKCLSAYVIHAPNEAIAALRLEVFVERAFLLAGEVDNA